MNITVHDDLIESLAELRRALPSMRLGQLIANMATASASEVQVSPFTIDSAARRLYLSHGTYYSGSLYDLPLVASMAWMAVPGLLALGLPKEHGPIQKAPHRGFLARRQFRRG